MTLATPNEHGAHLFTSESVSMGHPDKVADQISDAILDSLLEHDPHARAAIETLVTTGLVVLAGEVTVHNEAAARALEAAEQTARRVIRDIGYDDPETGFDYRSCAVMRTLHAQSVDISQGVTEGQGLHTEQGAGDQGLMFGFACDETKSLMPLPIHLSHRIMESLAAVRLDGSIPWLRPDGKAQVTVKYENDLPVGIDTVVVSTQHTEEAFDSGAGRLSDQAKQAIIDQVIKPVIQRECGDRWSKDIEFLINPTGRFVIGGPHGDAGLTGRKIIVDTYGGMGRHGGGAFSGKDPTKVDRSASYMARHIAKNIVAAGLASRCEVQLAYAIGMAEPVSVHVDYTGPRAPSAGDAGTAGQGSESSVGHGKEDLCSPLGSADLVGMVREVFPLTPRGIIEYLDLRRPIYAQTACHGHFGREGDGFSWEKINRVADLRNAAGSVIMAASS